MANLHRIRSNIRRIAIPDVNGLSFLTIDDITYCEADGNYTMIHFINEKKVVCRTLGHFETGLSDYGFLRVHHKYLVNLNHVKAYTKGKGGGSLIMDNEDVVPVSARKKGELFRHFIHP